MTSARVKKTATRAVVFLAVIIVSLLLSGSFPTANALSVYCCVEGRKTSIDSLFYCCYPGNNCLPCIIVTE